MKYFSFSMICCFCIACNSNSDESDNNYDVDINLAMETNWVLAKEVNVQINDYRKQNNLSMLTVDSGYASAYAVEHNMYMINRGMISHDNYGYRVQALKRHGAKKVGEIVAYGYDSAEDVVAAWLLSPNHKKIIDGEFRYIGFGITKNATGINYFTLLFYQ